MNDALNNARCRLCNSNDSSPLFSARDYVTGQRFEVVGCRNCTFRFTYPQPMLLDQYYGPHYRDYRGLVGLLLKGAYSITVRKWTRRCLPGRVLEVGCGEGWMLAAFRRLGWETVGVERQGLAERTAKNVGTSVFISLEEVEASNETFDVVVFHQVLEHLPDPLESLTICHRVLKPGGRLIVQVPNIESWQSKWTEAHWVHLDVPRHLCHFSKETLRDCLVRAGFRNTVVSGSVGIHDVFGWLQSGLNWMGFPQNLLMRYLAGESKLLCTPSGIVMLGVAVVLFPVALSATLISAILGDSAVIDAVGIK